MATGDIAPRLSPNTRKGSGKQFAWYSVPGTIVQPYTTTNAVLATNSSGQVASLTGTNAAVYFNGSSTPTSGTLPVNAGGTGVATTATGIFGNWSASVGAPGFNGGGSTGQVPTWQANGSIIWATPTGAGTVNSGTAGQLTWYASTGTTVSGNANATISSGALTLGVAGTAAGSLILSGGTSGTVTISVPSVAGSGTTFSLPAANSNPVQPLGSGTAHQWVQYIDSSGVQHTTQPAFTDISGTITVAQGGTGATSLTGNSVVTTNAGGTAQTALTGTNQAVFFNGSSVPTAGVLPFAAGGTGLTAPFDMGLYTFSGGV